MNAERTNNLYTNIFRFTQKELAYFFCICLLFVTLRVAFLNFQPIYHDEIYTLNFCTNNSPLSIITGKAFDSAHPPLYYIILSTINEYIIKLNYNNIRIFSVIFSIFLILPFYLVAFRLYGHQVAVLSLALLSVSPFHISLSQFARNYSLAILLSVISIWSFIVIYKDEEVNPKIDLIFVISTLALMYTHYAIAINVIITETIYLLFFRKYLIKNFFVRMLIIAFFYSYWIAIFLMRFERKEVPLQNFFHNLHSLLILPLQLTFFKAFLNRSTPTPIVIICAIILTIILAYLICIYVRSILIKRNYKEMTSDFFLISLCFSSFLVYPLFILMIIIRVLEPHYMAISIIAFSLLTAASLFRINKEKLKKCLAGGILFFMSIGLYSYYTKPIYSDYESAYRWLTEHTQNPRIILRSSKLKNVYNFTKINNSIIYLDELKNNSVDQNKKNIMPIYFIINSYNYSAENIENMLVALKEHLGRDENIKVERIYDKWKVYIYKLDSIR